MQHKGSAVGQRREPDDDTGHPRGGADRRTRVSLPPSGGRRVDQEPSDVRPVVPVKKVVGGMVPDPSSARSGAMMWPCLMLPTTPDPYPS